MGLGREERNSTAGIPRFRDYASWRRNCLPACSILRSSGQTVRFSRPRSTPRIQHGRHCLRLDRKGNLHSPLNGHTYCSNICSGLCRSPLDSIADNIGVHCDFCSGACLRRQIESRPDTSSYISVGSILLTPSFWS